MPPRKQLRCDTLRAEGQGGSNVVIRLRCAVERAECAMAPKERFAPRSVSLDVSISTLCLVRVLSRRHLARRARGARILRKEQGALKLVAASNERQRY